MIATSKLFLRRTHSSGKPRGTVARRVSDRSEGHRVERESWCRSNLLRCFNRLDDAALAQDKPVSAYALSLSPPIVQGSTDVAYSKGAKGGAVVCSASSFSRSKLGKPCPCCRGGRDRGASRGQREDRRSRSRRRRRVVDPLRGCLLGVRMHTRLQGAEPAQGPTTCSFPAMKSDTH